MASSLLEEMCPDATPVQIQEALSASGGDANQAADALLGKHIQEKKTLSQSVNQHLRHGIFLMPQLFSITRIITIACYKFVY